MANNQYVNKVEFGNEVLIDLTNDTVTADKILAGYTAHSASGASITGSIPTKTGRDFTQTEYADLNVGRAFLMINVPAGYYNQDAGFGVSAMFMPVPSTGTVKFVVYIPNGTTTPNKNGSGDYFPLEVEVDSEGNSNVTVDNDATGVMF